MRQECRQQKRRHVAPWLRCPTAARPNLPAHCVIGRRTFHSQHALEGVLNEQDEWCTDDKQVEEILWRSRQSIWTHTPALLPAAQIIREAYRDNRNEVLPHIPTPSRERVLGHVLCAGGSAPGGDCQPYEVYHFGSRFVSCLLGQAKSSTSLREVWKKVILIGLLATSSIKGGSKN